MTKKPFFLVLCVLALAIFAFGWFWLAFPVVAPPPASPVALARTATSSPDFEILYTATGYVPSSLEVPLGSSVAFKNTIDIPMWTASDPHPTHTDYPEFDAKKGYLAGEVYTFQFTKTGTFGFHNHERSLDRGIIRVADSANLLPNIDKTKESQRATRNKLLAMLEPNNPDSVFKVIDAIQGNQALARDCHDMAHDLGHRAYELYGFSAAMTFSNPKYLSHTSVDDICAGGYMHGVMEELFLHQPELKNQLSSICISIPIINRDSCFHGVGHSLMFVNERDVAASLDGCRTINNTIYTRRCFEGV
ncbi:MAG TPA: hypothetical protein VE973_01235, partial [Candidatus Limnocylindria bacterium]|nr:hypothetical protein [Candidatus Limnocylindria bacterium]